jgi:alkanesulfonate monooxygenase SsuD/methylene tetrahydromethanopterin reductase-like flavin-dependent oxidoreductase (luciferase family)
MRAGMSLTFTGESYLDADDHVVAHGADVGTFRRELALARMAEPLGFDSVWGVEHHFSSYSMSPEPLQFLSYMAGQTSRIGFGTMVTVAPWHNPARLAGAISMLDNLCGGRFTLGLGRGLGRTEFAGHGVPMGESRDRFVDTSSIVLRALEDGYLESDGPYHAIPRSALRPMPTRTFRGRTYASAVSPESYDTMARLGIGLMIIPQKPWNMIIEDVRNYRALYEQLNGEEAPEPIVVAYVFCDEDAGRAQEMGEHYIGDYYSACVKHYELGGSHFAQQGGYTYYQQNSARVVSTDHAHARRNYADLQVYGTPAQCLERVAHIKDTIGCCELLSIFSYSDLSFEEASRNVRLWAGEVMPSFQKLSPGAKPTLVP